MTTTNSLVDATPEPDRSWSALERRAWKLLAGGRTVDLRGIVKPDPKQADDWTQDRRRTRRLSPTFLRSIVMLKPWCQALRPEGIRILGAVFENGIDLSRGTIACPVQLETCRIEGAFDASEATYSASFSLDDSWIAGSLNLTGAIFAGTASLQRAAANYVLGVSARFGRNLNFTHFKCNAGLALSFAQVEGELNLTNARIGGSLLLTAATLRGRAFMSGIRVRGLLDAEQVSAQLLVLSSEDLAPSRFYGAIQLLGAKIETDLDFRRALVRSAGPGPLQRFAINLARADIKGFVRLDGVRLAGNLMALGLHVGGNFILGDVSSIFRKPTRSRLHDVVLAGSRIDGDLVLHGSEPLWRGRRDASMSLSHTQVGGLDDYRYAWPPKLNLTGFAYARTEPQHPYALDPFGSRETEWLLAWLGRTQELGSRSYVEDARTLSPLWRALGRSLSVLARHLPGPLGSNLFVRSLGWSMHFGEMDQGFRPETYERLALAIRGLQRHETADRILFEAREKARRNSVFPRSFWLWLSRVLIGYGIGAGYFRAVGFALAAAVLGVAVILLDGKAYGFHGEIQGKSLTWLFFASLDHLVPIMHFDKDFEIIPRALTSVPAKVYFWLMGISGWILSSFLIAGLAGITQRSRAS